MKRAERHHLKDNDRSTAGLFRGFNDARLDALSRAADEITFNNSEIILREGFTVAMNRYNGSGKGQEPKTEV